MKPRVDDNGAEVTLDLHGVTVGDAVTCIRRAARYAFERGRGTLRIIHGTSTSSRLERNRTIKHELHRLLDEGALETWIASAWRDEGHAVLTVRIDRASDPRRITLAEVMGR